MVIRWQWSLGGGIFYNAPAPYFATKHCTRSQQGIDMGNDLIVFLQQAGILDF